MDFFPQKVRNNRAAGSAFFVLSPEKVPKEGRTLAASGIVLAGSLNDHERLCFSHDRSGRSPARTLSLPRLAKCASRKLSSLRTPFFAHSAAGWILAAHRAARAAGSGQQGFPHCGKGGRIAVRKPFACALRFPAPGSRSEALAASSYLNIFPPGIIRTSFSEFPLRLRFTIEPDSFFLLRCPDICGPWGRAGRSLRAAEARRSHLLGQALRRLLPPSDPLHRNTMRRNKAGLSNKFR